VWRTGLTRTSLVQGEAERKIANGGSGYVRKTVVLERTKWGCSKKRYDLIRSPIEKEGITRGGRLRATKEN